MVIGEDKIAELRADYNEVVRLSKEETFNDNLDTTERIKVISSFYANKQLNEYTKYLFYATVLLFITSLFALIKELSGPEYTKGLIGSIALLALRLLIIIGILVCVALIHKTSKDKIIIILNNLLDRENSKEVYKNLKDLFAIGFVTYFLILSVIMLYNLL